MRPVVTDVGRKLTREIELDGYRIPAGTLVMPAIAAIHFRADLYPEPDEFRPERFLQAHAGCLHVDPVRRRRAPLHRGLVRAVRDARDHQDDPRARAAAGGRAPARAVKAAQRDRGAGARVSCCGRVDEFGAGHRS